MTISPFANRIVYRKPASRSSWRGFISLLLILGLGGTAAWFAFQSQVQHQLRDSLQTKLNGLLAGSMLTGRIEKAEFIENQGIRLYDVKLGMKHLESEQEASRTFGTSNAAQPPVTVEIYEAFVKLPVSMPELLTSSPQPTAIQIRRARIRLEQSPTGDWNLGKLFEQLSQLKPQCDNRIPIQFRDCSIELVSENPEQPSLIISDASLQIDPIEYNGRPLIQIQGSFNGQEINGTEITLFVDESQKQWQADLSVPRFLVRPQVLALLPNHLRDQLSRWPKIEGLISAKAQASGDFLFATPTRFSCKGQLKGFACEDPKLPIPIRKTDLSFEFNNDLFKIENANGKLGDGDFHLNLTQSGFESDDAWELNGKLDNFNFSHLEPLLPLLPETLRAFHRRFSPRGTANLTFDFSEGAQRRKRELRGELINAAFVFRDFPYEIDNCTGSGSWIGDQCQFEIRSNNGPRSIQLAGIVNNPGPKSTFKVEISVPNGVTIDDKLQIALQSKPKLFPIINDFSPNGRISLLGQLEKSVPDGEILHAYDIRLLECNVKHRLFDYPIYGINGMVQVRKDRYSFVELSGNSNGASITANGNFNPEEGLTVRFLGKSVPLDNQMKNALTPDLRKIWSGFRPQGTIDEIQIDLIKPINERIQVTVDALIKKPDGNTETQSVTINPVWFPYEIQQLSGVVKIGNGKIELSDIKGQHDRTWMACVGEGEYSPDEWWLRLNNLLVGSLKVDEALLEAVPKALTPPIRKLAFEGLINVHGEVTLAGKSVPTKLAPIESPSSLTNEPASQTSSNSLAWNLRFDLNQAKMTVGVPLENVFGNVQLTGQYDGQLVDCSGDLAIDSLTVFGAQITELKGPISLNGERAMAGAFVGNQQVRSLNTDFSPADTPQDTARSITGRLYQGEFKIDAKMASDLVGEFYLQTTLSDACLNQLCKDNAPNFSDVKGRSYAALRLSGNSLGTHSYRGDGRIQLRKAEIMELPVMLSVLKSMRVGTKSQTAFDESNVDFKIAGEDIEFTRIEMLGEPISLLGNGTANLNREIDLNFYSVMGKNRFHIPILSDLYKASSQQVLWINVDGTINDPQTHRNVLPQLNDSLKQLFQPVEPQNIARQRR